MSASQPVTWVQRWLRLLCLPALLLPAVSDSADDNRLAWRLFNQEQHAQAAELFSNPAWKGVALYRSTQWWRAAEAFVRANNPDSLYNLGNTYAKLGYHALALEAYLATLAINPAHGDAKFNADLIRKVLAAQQDNKGQSALTPKEREIDRLKKEQEEKKKGQQSSAGEEQTKQNTDADQERRDTTNKAQDEQAGSTANSGGDNASRDARREQTDTTENRLSGRAVDEPADNEVSGGSKSSDEQGGDPTAGKRLRLEKSQATAQWLNAIEDKPGEFLARRISQEMRRREAAGTLPAKNNDPW